MQSPIC